MASLSLKNVTKRYADGVEAVKKFNLDIEDKEFIVLVGPSGCGKSTTLRMIAGLEEISEGEVKIGSKVVNDVAPKDRDIAMVFQSYALYPHMSVFDNMAFSLKLRKVPDPNNPKRMTKIPKDEIKRRVEEAAKILDIEHLLERKPKALSGGQRQRVALGRAIVREPQVFLMDEPLSNLDAKLRVQMRTEISKLHQRLNTTFIYVTHDQTEAMTMGTRIVVMKDGVVQQVDSPQVLYETPNNLFVAGFMGSPQMNFIDSKLEKKEDGYYVTFASYSIKIPEGKAGAAQNLDDYVGKDVVLGIRPENIHDEEAFLNMSPDSAISVKVEVTEAMGAETFLYLDFEGKKFTARVNPRTLAKPNDVIKVALDLNKIHLFDKETEKTIFN